MLTELVKLASVYLFSMFKFVLGPATGVLAELNFFTTVILTIAGMMTSVTLFTFLGEYVRVWYFKKFQKKDSRVFTRKKRTMVRVWRRFGMIGVAMLTPVILSPIGGTIIAVSFGEDKWRIFIYMLLSSILWSLILSVIFYYIKSIS